MTTKLTDEQPGPMDALMAENEDLILIPEVGQMVDGTVVWSAKTEVHVDIGGVTTGIVRGPELYDESGTYTDLQVGDHVQATVLDLENELGQVELSFRAAGHKIAWDNLQELLEKGDVVEALIRDANKGGLIVRVGRVDGFLPVSQLTVEHYPRVEGGNKRKILERLQTYIGQTFKVKLLDLDETENKLILSEKLAWEEAAKGRLDKYEIGDIVNGVVTGVVDFGAFVKFDDDIEGLVHISELAWQRIDNPRDVIKEGDKVNAKVIDITDGKVSLSMRRLQDDPWKQATEKYNIGQVVKGVVLKINSFGAFVELDTDIHGLAHISELSKKKITHPSEVVKEGQEYHFQILTIEPNKHRLGLSMKALGDVNKDVEDAGEEAKEEKPEDVEEVKEDSTEEPPKEDKKEEAPKEESVEAKPEEQGEEKEEGKEEPKEVIPEEPTEESKEEGKEEPEEEKSEEEPKDAETDEKA